MVVTLTLDRGDRRTLRIPVTREGTGDAGPLQFRVGTGAWTSVSPDDATVNPAAYSLVLAFGDDFPTSNPAGTVVITGTVGVWVRPPSGTDIDVQQVAWIRTDG